MTRWLRVGGAVALVSLAIEAAVALPLSRWIGQLVHWMQAAGPIGALAYSATYVIAAVFMLPGAILTAGAGLAYGPLWGTLLVSPVSVVGATCAFLLGRSILRDWVARRTARDPKFRAVDAAIAEHGLKIVILLRLSPVFPFNVLNYALALTGVTLRDYVLGSFVGMLPGTLLYVYVGSVVRDIAALSQGTTQTSTTRHLLSGVGLAATIAVTIYVTRLARGALADQLGEQSDASPHLRRSPLMNPELREPLMNPDDVHNRALIEFVHPPDWRNPESARRYNVVVVGGGTAGLVSAVGAAGLGARVAIVERHLLGGDCLNYACVPSKALVRAARAAADVRRAAEFGTNVGSVKVDFGAAMDRMRRLRTEIAKNDSVARLSSLGIDVFLGQARFVAADAIEVNGHRLRFARAIIATGGRAAAPPIPGLEEAGYLTNESVFSLTTLPASVVVIGAGPTGCELAQAFSRFGAHVTIVSDSAGVLPREDPDASAIIRTTLEREGIRLMTSANVTRVEREPGSGGRRVFVEHEGRQEVMSAEVVLVATGRTPNVEGLDLERAGIAWDRHGVTVDDRLRTTNPRVWAAGDIASVYKFTHAADALARIAVQNALFFGRKAASALVIPWATYTDPEVAHVGMSAEDAMRRADVRTLTVPFADVDRAVLDGASDGFARVHVDARGRILGATLVAPHAGDLIGQMSVAMTAGVRMATLARTIHPYPTQAEVWKKLGDAWNLTKLTPRVRLVFEAFLRWRR